LQTGIVVKQEQLRTGTVVERKSCRQAQLQTGKAVDRNSCGQEQLWSGKAAVRESSCGMVAESERRRADETNPYNANISTSIGTLRRNGKGKKVKVHKTIRQNYREGNFRRIQYDGRQHIMLEGFNDGTIGYIVPAESVEAGKGHGSCLSKSIGKLPKNQRHTIVTVLALTAASSILECIRYGQPMRTN
jgi:hypothetical protein